MPLWYINCVKPWLEPLTAIGTLVALVAVIVTVIKNRSDERARQQQELLEQCKRTLEWAYNALMPDPHAEFPPPNRLNWLTTARHVVAYQKLKKLITLQPQVRILEDFEEFWRHRFYLALSHQALATHHYFSKPDIDLGNSIDTTSALIVVDFSGWPQGKVDPTDLTEAEVASLKAHNGFTGNAGKGVKQYVKWWEDKHAANKAASGEKAADA